MTEAVARKKVTAGLTGFDLTSKLRGLSSALDALYSARIGDDSGTVLDALHTTAQNARESMAESLYQDAEPFRTDIAEAVLYAIEVAAWNVCEGREGAGERLNTARCAYGCKGESESRRNLQGRERPKLRAPPLSVPTLPCVSGPLLLPASGSLLAASARSSRT